MLNELYTLTDITDFPIHIIGDVYNGGTYNGEGVYSSHSSSPAPAPTPTPAPASSTPPTTLGISNVDASPYMSTLITKTGSWPTITGTAPPNSAITITFTSNSTSTSNSVVTICKTTANSSGNWSCTLTQALMAGTQNVEITAVTPSGQSLSLPSFKIQVVTSGTSATSTGQKTAPKVIPAKTDFLPIILGLIIAAIAIGMLILFLLKRRKKKEEDKKPPMQSGLIQ